MSNIASMSVRASFESPGTLDLKLGLATVTGLNDSGSVVVTLANGMAATCLMLNGAMGTGRPTEGLRVLVAWDGSSEFGVVLGKVGPMGDTAPPDSVTVSAGESLTLRCGESSIDLRADGKVVIKGDDVLVRAKGTKRIRAGSVSIN